MGLGKIDPTFKEIWIFDFRKKAQKNQTFHLALGARGVPYTTPEQPQRGLYVISQWFPCVVAQGPNILGGPRG